MLAQIRDPLLMLAGFVFVATQGEEYAPLEIKQSMRGRYFEAVSMQIDDVLDMAYWPRRSVIAAKRSR